ncbi:hypothetical protein Y1Q_0008960 [Alligator mississippiensis]|uniref:Reverse transcriptase domain-containing protein n=1 Tax=Alligator mississippiensis TaxID=8496 RepID=A0A151NKF0_ALLMI|nr:hypothetical protein Y1Q_0008960 [Alligator mississippiensis]
MPTSWKRAMTVLIHKKGTRATGDPSSLCSTVAKLYTSCLVANITNWAVTSRAVSQSQKGFMSTEGCYKHNFTLQMALDNAWRTRKQCVVACLDISNAFGCVPHRHIFSTLHKLGLLDGIIDLVQELYHGCTTTVRTTNGQTTEIPIRSGVRQGCPLSPIIFNLAMELLLRAMAGGPSRLNLYGQKLSILAYTDDLVLLAP